MSSLDEIINQAKDSREVKRALSIKMGLKGISPALISQVLNVSAQYVSKWKRVYESEGAEAIQLGYQGSQGYLSDLERTEVSAWIKSHQTLSVEALREHVESTYQVVYQSKQSYYDLLEAGGMSYHQTEKTNPKRDEGQVQARREELQKNWQHTERPSSKRKS